MKTVSIYELRNNLAEYLNLVTESDVSMTVSRFGKPIAKITPYTNADAPPVDSYFGCLGKGETGDVFLKRVRRSPAEKQRVNIFRGV